MGVLPETLNLELVEPLRELFKDEVRKLGVALGLALPAVETLDFLTAQWAHLPHSLLAKVSNRMSMRCGTGPRGVRPLGQAAADE